MLRYGTKALKITGDRLKELVKQTRPWRGGHPSRARDARARREPAGGAAAQLIANLIARRIAFGSSEPCRNPNATYWCTATMIQNTIW